MNDKTIQTDLDQIGKDGPWQTLQVLPLANLMYPCSPHEVLHEFLMIHDSWFEPTMKTAWLMLFSQLLKIPEA